MKILLYAYSPVLGGMFRHVTALAARLKNMGHEPFVVGNFITEIAESASLLNSIAVPFHPLAVEGKFDFGGLRRFRKFLKREHFDVIHFHLGDAFGSLSPLLLTLMMGFPVVVTEHYLPFPLSSRRLLPMLGKRLAAGRIGKIILLGEAFVAPYLELTRIDRSKIAVIPPFSEGMTLGSKKGDRRSIGFAGRFSLGKGIDTLVRLAPTLIDLNYRLIFCGRGEWETEIDRLVAAYPQRVEKRFYSTGMERFYEDIGVLLFLSRSEGLPLAVLEAVSSGIPVVSSRVGVLEEYFRDGDGIVYLPSREPAAVLSALRNLQDDRFREEVVFRGKKSFLDLLDPAKVSRRIEGLYKELAR